MKDQENHSPSILADGDFYSNAFSFYSHISGSVDPRTGMYSAGIDLPTGKGNRLRGPHLEFRLNFDALSATDDGFGVGWRLGLSLLDRDTNILTLGSGDSHRIGDFTPGEPATFPDRKLESFRLVRGTGKTAVIEHATGVIEHLENTEANPYLMRPVRIVNPGGNAIHLTWELHNGVPALTRVVDDEGETLLTINYTDARNVYLFIPTGLSRFLEMRFERLGDVLERVRTPAIMDLNEAPGRGEDDEPVWAFGYQTTDESPQLRLLTSVTSPDGIVDKVTYNERGMDLPTGAPRRYMPVVSERRRTLVAEPARHPDSHLPARGRFVQTSTYRYTAGNFYGYPLVDTWDNRNDQLMHHGAAGRFSYGSTETQLDEVDTPLCTIEREYNHFHLITTETTTRGTVVQEIVTAYGEVPNEPFYRQPVSFQLPHKITTTLYNERNAAVKMETFVENTYDPYGNLISRLDSATGIVERSTYFPLDGEPGLCPADPLKLARRLRSETTVPGPGGGPTLTGHYRYCELPVRKALSQDDVYVQACGEWLTLDDTGDTLVESQQGFIVDQGDQHGAIAWETRTQDELTERRDFSYRTDGAATVTTHTTHTTHDNIVNTTTESLTLLAGLVASSVDISGNRTDVSYDTMARPVAEVRVRDRSERFAASSWRYQLTTSERWIRRIGTTGLEHRVWVDEQGRVIEREEPLADGRLATMFTASYNAFGEISESRTIDHLGSGRTLVLVSRYRYDDWGRCNELTNPDGSHVRTDVALVVDDGEVFISTTSWQEAGGIRIGAWTSSYTDAAGRERRTETGTWENEKTVLAYATWSYDGLGRVIESTDPMGLVSRQAWDPYDRLIETILPDGSVFRRGYALGHTEDLIVELTAAPSGADQAIVVGTRIYDGLARVEKETAGSLSDQMRYEQGELNPVLELLAGGGVIERTYDPWLNGAVLTEILQGSPPTRLKEAEYSPVTGLPERVASDGGSMKIRADYLGRMTQQNIDMGDGLNRWTNVDVSLAGLQLSKTGVDGARQVFDYDDFGRVVKVSHETAGALPLVETSIAYDDISRPLTRHTRKVDGSLLETWTYDDRGRISTLVWSYDTGGIVDRQRLLLTWRDDNKVAGKLWFSGVEDRLLREEAMTYDERGRLTLHDIVHAEPGEFPADESGNAFRRQIFDHDFLDNLRSVTTLLVDGRSNTTAYTYDGTDRDRLSGVESTVRGYPGYGTALTLRYDGNGNLVDDGQGSALSWDGAGRLVSLTLSTGQVIEYSHGPDGRISRIRRAGRTSFRYYDDGLLYGEFADNDERRYLRVNGNIVAESLLSSSLRKIWLLGSDPQGSAIVEAGDNAAVRKFDAYGNHDAKNNGARTGYAGEISEEDVGWYLLGERFYAPALRRFISPDGASPFEGGGPNRYAYCAGDPINRIDPSGNSPLDWIGLIAGAIGAAIAVIGTGGALLAAAPGLVGLTAALTTPGMMVSIAATSLEVASVAVELGGIVAASTGDENTAGILGWVAFGTGIASGALSTALPSAKRSTRFILGKQHAGGMDMPRSPIRERRKSYPGITAKKEVWLHPGTTERRVKLYRGDAATRKLGSQPVDRSKNVPDALGVQSIWYSKQNARGGIVHYTDTQTSGNRVIAHIKATLASSNSNDPIIILTGRHGNMVGDNYVGNATRTHLAVRSFYNQDVASAQQLTTHRRVYVIDISQKTKAEVARYLQIKGDVFTAFCYSGADPLVMESINLAKIKIYHL